MVEIKSEIEVRNEDVKHLPADKAELLLKDRIGKEISKNILTNIDDVAFLDIEPLHSDLNHEGFRVKAEIVVCSMSSIVTAIGQMAKKMAEYDLEEEQIEEILEIITKDSRGW